MSILERLYLGNLCPIEEAIPPDIDYCSLGLSKEQKAIVDKKISAANDCGAAYGAVAYKLELQDGIKLMSELKEIK